MTLDQFLLDIIIPKTKTELGLMVLDLMGISYIALSDIDGFFNTLTHGVVAISVSFGLFVKIYSFFKKNNKNEKV